MYQAIFSVPAPEVSLGTRLVNTMRNTSGVDEVLDKHSAVFGADLSCMKGQKVKLHVDDSVPPKFHKPRTVPFMLREKVENELQRLHAEGIISPVKFASWAAPIVPVLKKDNTVRICGDFKVTNNKALLNESYITQS